MAQAEPSVRLDSSIDPNQLLSLCFRIGECTRQLESSISLCELYLATLSYVDADTQASSLKYLDQLLGLDGLSQSMVHLLDELNTKLSETAPGSIENQIACQQLAHFSGLWFSEFTPKLERLFATSIAEATIRNNAGTGSGTELSGGSARSGAEPTGVRDALLRLRGSVSENERLIGSIAANVDSTRTTIESIYESLQAARRGLLASRGSALQAAHLLSGERCRKLLVALVLGLLICALLYYLSTLLVG